MTTANSTAILTPQEADIPKWQRATWEDYLGYRDNPNLERVRVFFHKGYLLIEMGNEGINHASISDLLTMVFAFWFARQPGVTFSSFGRCVIEKPKRRAAAPDQVLYIGAGAPRWQDGEPRRINLNKWRVPDLVGEVADTTLATDLDEKKQIYAAMKIPEYWVTDVRGKRVLAFQLQEDGNYQQCEYSGALSGLPIAVLNGTLERLSDGDHASATLWFNQQIVNL
ncbi:MAG: Uma2 family endonuclease [Oscillatoriaceae cyanobacterium]